MKSERKPNLLKMSKRERTRLINQMRETLRRRKPEQKLWNSLLQVENLTINGQQIF